MTEDNEDEDGVEEGKLGGSARLLGDPGGQHQHHTASNSLDGVKGFRRRADNNDVSNLKPVPAAYRPASIPTCSLCGKAFKPEKLHSHLKSCRGMKMVAKNTVTDTGARDKESSWRSATSTERDVSFQMLRLNCIARSIGF